MTISAKIIADSISPQQVRITSVQLRYPRFCHSELMTHRVFSRNASSSRAIPVSRLIDDIIKDTAMPISWGKNKPGMQAGEEHNELVPLLRRDYSCATYLDKEAAWLKARDAAVDFARAFSEAGYHKQIVNRLLEPFSHINVLVTSTYWENFFKLRDHKDAQPEIAELARQIKAVMNNSTPNDVYYGQWHLPYISNEDRWRFDHIEQMLHASVARCARVSYLTHDGKQTTVEEDLKLYERLVASEPLHASPCEHQATPTDKFSDKCGNFYFWKQYRKMLKGEFVDDFARTV